MADPRVPDWAYHRVDELAGDDTHYRNAFARYIASKEEAPVDPLLIEARALAADYMTACNAYSTGTLNAVRTGNSDDHIMVQTVMAALKRGMEIGALQEASK